ncbi:hypothetical protein Lal_00033822 [Lupinus albus]|nr:hypothetical protein Lal_00033822 [Lupinus albus]
MCRVSEKYMLKILRSSLMLESLAQVQKCPNKLPNSRPGDKCSLKKGTQNQNSRILAQARQCPNNLSHSRLGDTSSLKRGCQVKNSWILVQAREPRLRKRAKIQRTKIAKKKNPSPLKKQKVRTSSHAVQSFDRHKFTTKEREEHFTTFLHWVFIPERRTLASPNDKFDPEVVQEFYANAYPKEEGREIFKYKSWDIINALLNHPYEKWDGHLDGYHQMLTETRTYNNKFKNSVIAELLCILGRSYNTNSDGQPLRIYRKHMTTLAQI